MQNDQIHYETTLEEIKKKGYDCSCSHCRNGCLFGSGSMINEDIKNMSKLLEITEKELKQKYLENVKKFNTKRYRPRIIRKNKPYGKCIFYDEKIGCKVHKAKPLECSIAMGCTKEGPDLIEWFHAHYFLDLKNEDSIRNWNQMVKIKGTIPGARIEELMPDEKTRKLILERFKKNGKNNRN